MANKRVPFGGTLCFRLTKNLSVEKRTSFFKIVTVILTYFAYMSYKLTRRVFAVVAPSLKNGSACIVPVGDGNRTVECHQEPWAPFGSSDQNALIACLSLVFLSSYAVGMFLAGRVAERMDLRYFLVVGMTVSSTFCCLFGLAKVLQIHSYDYFVLCELANGFAHSTGYPAIVSCVGNWFGFGKRGFLFGLWNSNTSLGRILGSVVAGMFVDRDWSLSFIIPGLLMFVVTLTVYLFLVPLPEMVGCQKPNHVSAAEKMSMPESKEKFLRDKLSKPSEVDDVRETDDETVALLEGAVPANDDVKLEVEKEAIGLLEALKIPGVVEYSLCLFFNKLVMESLIYWLPTYIKENLNTTTEKAAYYTICFDLGGLIGSIVIGAVSDFMGERCLVTCLSIFLATPLMLSYWMCDNMNATGLLLLFLIGFLTIGSHNVISTAVSSDLGTHKSLRSSKRALATVTGIINGTGSVGAAAGAFICFIANNPKMFSMFIAANLFSLMFLLRLLKKAILFYVTECRILFSARTTFD